MPKSPFRSRTVWFSFFLMALGILQVLIPQIVLDPLQQGLLLGVVGIFTLLLRFATKDPLV